MADENNPSPAPAEDSNGLPPVGQPAPKGDDGSSPEPDATEQARRDQQSKKDQAVSQAGKSQTDIDYLMGREAIRERDEFITGFLTEHKDKFPNVEAADLKFAGSPDEAQALAAHLQNKFKSMQQDALSSVQGTEQEFLTPTQLKDAEEALKKETATTGKSQFSAWLNKKALTKR